ncbi:MAG: AsnC family transcriptional regulator [Rhodospirillaceae bacterium]|jgi:siroheme decarboxylase|nr:AsnC family transcriptional regulator [Rhodospirillaceae bacterium]MBT4589003.1 AsnC family transcriptional regulator [Rhodospirillaceae bacterium]MBT4939085.1 AsnC family transcriptional regulator [Rhodospirillaceae bacterium]MBT5940849.1 AsnC family transcriptional regulator [Rhodospirillaceae bacterium]MBT7266687.1 AsnC family transcriptional regulator [Rhodospirillaceae bacterium]
MLDVDRQIINALQGGFPISERPYAEAAEKLGLSEDALIARLAQLLEDKMLSRFGPMYNSEKMGGAVTLAAIAVPKARFKEVTGIVNSFAEVAHNYQREHKLNMWFVIAAEEPGEIAEVIEKIEAATGLEVFNMPKSEEYFLEMKLAI